MPEAPIHENRKAVLRKHQIRCAALRELAMKPEPGTGGVQRFPKEHLWNCVRFGATRKMPASGGAHPLLWHRVMLDGRLPANHGHAMTGSVPHKHMSGMTAMCLNGEVRARLCAESGLH